MAKQRHGINDAYYGSVGKVIGYDWRGKHCLRSKPESVANPRTEKQIANRKKMSFVTKLAREMKMVIDFGFDEVAWRTHTTSYNQFIKTNYGCITFSETGVEIDYEKLRIGAGEIAGVVFDVIEERGERSFKVKFSDCESEGRREREDRVYLFAYCPQIGEGKLYSPVFREVGEIKWEQPNYWGEGRVHYYGIVQDGKGRASDSVYVGHIDIGNLMEATSLDKAIMESERMS